MHVKTLQKTVALHSLPSGHVAVEVLEFGEPGFTSSRSLQCWISRKRLSLHFWLRIWMCHVWTDSPLQSNLNHVGSTCFFPPSRPALSRRCADACGGRSGAWPRAQCQKGNSPLEASVGQDLPAFGVSWARGVRAFMASVGFDGDAILSAFFRAAGATHRRRRTSASCEGRDGAASEPGDLPSDWEQVPIST